MRGTYGKVLAWGFSFSLVWFRIKSDDSRSTSSHGRSLKKIKNKKKNKKRRKTTRHRRKLYCRSIAALPLHIDRRHFCQNCYTPICSTSGSRLGLKGGFSVGIVIKQYNFLFRFELLERSHVFSCLRLFLVTTYSCFLFLLLQLVSEFIVLYTCYSLTEKGRPGPLGPTTSPPLCSISFAGMPWWKWQEIGWGGWRTPFSTKETQREVYHTPHLGVKVGCQWSKYAYSDITLFWQDGWAFNPFRSGGSILRAAVGNVWSDIICFR